MRIDGGRGISSWFGFNSEQEDLDVDEGDVDSKEAQVETREELNQPEERESLDEDPPHRCEQNCYHAQQQSFFASWGQYCGIISSPSDNQENERVDNERVDNGSARVDETEVQEEWVSSSEYVEQSSSWESAEYGEGEEG